MELGHLARSILFLLEVEYIDDYHELPRAAGKKGVFQV